MDTMQFGAVMLNSLFVVLTRRWASRDRQVAALSPLTSETLLRRVREPNLLEEF